MRKLLIWAAALIVVAIGLIVLWKLTYPLPLRAHEAPTGWLYGSECCGQKDCHPIASDTVLATNDGWLILKTRETIRYSHDARLKQSRDENFHICPLPDGLTRCLYAPDSGS